MEIFAQVSDLVHGPLVFSEYLMNLTPSLIPIFLKSSYLSREVEIIYILVVRHSIYNKFNLIRVLISLNPV